MCVPIHPHVLVGVTYCYSLTELCVLGKIGNVACVCDSECFKGKNVRLQYHFFPKVFKRSSLLLCGDITLHNLHLSFASCIIMGVVMFLNGNVFSDDVSAGQVFA